MLMARQALNKRLMANLHPSDMVASGQDGACHWWLTQSVADPQL
jgi:hypothetical protein